MDGNKGKPQGRFRYPLTSFVFIACLVFWLVSMPVQWHLASAREASERPDLWLNTFIRSLREYRERKAKWPDRLGDLEREGLWQLADGEEGGRDGRNLIYANYYYRYYLLPDDVVSVWAIPLGKYASEGRTHFVLLGRSKMRHWMGPALTSGDVKMVVSYPTDEQFGLLMMKEQDATKPVEGRRRSILSYFE